MKTALALRHVHFEDLGLIEPLLRDRGYQVRYAEAGVDDIGVLAAQPPDLLVVLGAPIGAFDEACYPFLVDELTAIDRQIAAGAPLLGICLGAQLIARALGAGVAGMGIKEIGFSPLALTEEGRASPLAHLEGVAVLHWHGDRFELPAQSRRLAGTPVCDNQAFAVGRRILGLQFHLEADAAFLERWLIGHSCELAQAGVDPRGLRAQAIEASPRLGAAAGRVIGQWLDEAQA